MLSRGRGTPGVSLKTPSERKSAMEGIDFGPTAVFHEKFPNVGKYPFIFNENDWLTVGDGDGYQEYFKRQGRTKNAVKWGQLKLFTSELQFFNKYWNPTEVKAPLCVYVGSAPGTHIQYLTQLFPMFEFHLYDPRDVFDARLKTNPRVKLFVQFFTDEDAKKYAKRNDVFFVSDIRSTSYNKDQFSTEEMERENEKLVLSDMAMQKRWVDIIQPHKAHLKFRLPYGYGWQKLMPEMMHFNYFDGDVYKQSWAPQTSTETRLVPNLQVPNRKWNSQLYEKMMFYHNNVIREHAVFVNPITGLVAPADIELGLTQDYDSTVFLVTIQEYMKKFMSKEFVLNSEKSVMALAKAIIDNVGNYEISIANIRAGVKGKLSPDSDERLRAKLRAQGEDEDD
jgi:hypothetical protein